MTFCNYSRRKSGMSVQTFCYVMKRLPTSVDIRQCRKTSCDVCNVLKKIAHKKKRVEFNHNQIVRPIQQQKFPCIQNTYFDCQSMSENTHACLLKSALVEKRLCLSEQMSECLTLSKTGGGQKLQSQFQSQKTTASNENCSYVTLNVQCRLV